MARRRKAEHLITLVYVDGPQLVSMSSGKAKVVAVAIPSLDNYRFPFLATVIPESDWQRYQRGIVDLRFLFRFVRARRLFTFDLATIKDNSVYMIPWEESQPIPEEFLPAERFFSRDHTEETADAKPTMQVQRFGIDGAWGAHDFSSFYGKINDIYTFQLSLSKLRSEETDAGSRRRITEAFAHYPLRGGSSYVHLYDDLYKVQAVSERLDVKEIAYASPGHIDVAGRADLFETARAAIGGFGENREGLSKKYNAFHTYLSKLGYLTLSPDSFQTRTEQAQRIEAEAEELAGLLQMDRQSVDMLKTLSRGNSLVFAKIVLSYYRRLSQWFEFFAEGRVKFEGTPAVEL